METKESSYIVQALNVTKIYKSDSKQDVKALSNIDIKIRKGEICTILGPNGAGKTTLMKILSTMLLPSSGEINILGLNVAHNSQIIRGSIGLVLGGERGLYYRLSGMENVLYFASLYRVDIKTAKKRANELFIELGLYEKKDMLVETYSRGMKQRLHFIKALIHNPEILFLDEPTNGLDPIAANEIINLIQKLMYNKNNN